MARKKVVEVIDFSSVAEAQQTKAKCEKQMEKYPLARTISIIASIFGIIGLIWNFLSFLWLFAFIGSIVTYVLIGGFGAGLKGAAKIAKAGWFLIPIFPVDIFVFLVALVFAIYALFLVPVVTLRSARLTIEADLQAAEEYLQAHVA